MPPRPGPTRCRSARATCRRSKGTTLPWGGRRQHILQELTFAAGFVPTLVPSLAAATANKSASYQNVAASKSAELQLGSVVTYPATGKKVDPYILTILGGSGAFFGARGQATIAWQEDLQLYKQTVTLTFK